MSSPPTSTKRPGAREHAVSDDEILDWWELHDGGMSCAEISREYGRTYKTVLRHLAELGVMGDPLLTRALEGRLTDNEQAIYDALARCAPAEMPAEPARLPYALSLQHTKLVKRTVVQSARQRRQDEMCSRKWRKLVRQDMRAAGLLPRF